MTLINCEISLKLTWSSTCVITDSPSEGKFATQNFDVPIVTLTSQGNSKLLQQLKSGFKGYLRYKTITSENVPSKARTKNFFIS